MKKFVLLLFVLVGGAATLNAQSFIDRLSSQNTGIKGCVTWDGAYLKVSGHDDLSHPIKEGSSFELLNVSSIKDNSSLNTLKIKITYDSGDGDKTGLVGYIYPSLTSLKDVFDYSTNKVKIDYKNLIPTTYTGTTGVVTFEGLTLRMYSFEDTEPNLSNGTKIELLNTKMIKTFDCVGLYVAKVKVLDGPNKDKVGYVYANLTSFSSYIDYQKMVFNTPTGFINENGVVSSLTSSSNASSSFANTLSTVNTGSTGVVTFDGIILNIYSFDDSSPNLAKGTKIELLSNKMVVGGSISLNHVKVKVLDGPYAGKIGYMYPSSTSFSSYTDYANNTIYPPKGFTPDASATTTTNSTTTSVGSTDLPDYPTERTGITGNVNMTAGAYAYEDGSDWTVELKLAENATFVLLNKKVFIDAVTGDYYVKVRVTNDPSGTYTGKIMYITILDTDLSGRFDKSSSAPTVY